MHKNIFFSSVITVAVVVVFIVVGLSNSHAAMDEEQNLNTNVENSVDSNAKDSNIRLAIVNKIDDENEYSEIMNDDEVPAEEVKPVEKKKLKRSPAANASRKTLNNENLKNIRKTNIERSNEKLVRENRKNQNSEKASNVSEISEEAIAEDFSHVINIVTGSKTGTYYRFGNDIKQILTPDGIDIKVNNSKGSIENINKIGSGKATFGIVQSDVLGFLKRSNQPESRKIADKLRLVFPFYQEEVHLIANKTIDNFSDLNGKVIAVGPKGSGSWLTAVNLFKLTGIQPSKMLRLSPEKGLVAVLTNKADAMVFVAGKPVKLFKNLDSLADQEQYSYMLDNVHMIPVTDEKILKEYSSSVLTSDDYKFIEAPVSTIAVTAALISYDYSGNDSAFKKSRCNDVKNFSSAMYNKIEEIKVSGHPKWREVDLTAEIGLWNRDKCAKVSSISSTLEEEMLNELELNW